MTDWDAIDKARNEQTERMKPILARSGGWGRSDVPYGWEEIVLQLDQDIAKIVPNYTLDQVKEKFGGLRYYVSGIPDENFDEVYALVHGAESKSLTTCQDCGQEGEQGMVGTWVTTMCDACRTKRLEERAKRWGNGSTL